MSTVSRHDRLVQLLEPVVADEGFDLEGIAVTPAGKRRLLRVVVDADGGVSLDDVTHLNHVVSAALDSSDAMGAGPYVLEVSSPGVDRPLTEVRHWRRAAGRLVRAPLRAGGEVTGRLVSADDDGVVLDVDGAHRRFAHDELGRGKVQVEFRRSGDGGEGEEEGEP